MAVWTIGEVRTAVSGVTSERVANQAARLTAATMAITAAIATMRPPSWYSRFSFVGDGGVSEGCLGKDCIRNRVVAEGDYTGFGNGQRTLDFIELGKRRGQPPRFRQAGPGVLEASGIHRGLGPEHQPFGAPAAHPHFEALPLTRGGVRHHRRRRVQNPNPAADSHGFYGYGFDMAAPEGTPENRVSVSLLSSTQSP